MNMNMTSNLRVARKNSVVANLAIVCNMHICHDPIVITQPRNAIVLRRTSVNGGELSNGIAITDLQAGWFTALFHVLWRATNGSKMGNGIFSA
jgi:hypothetical protein